MVLCDYLKEIDRRMPNSLSDDDKIDFLNHAVRDIFRICGQEHTFKAAAGDEVLLPEEIIQGTICEVKVNDDEYFESTKVRRAGRKYVLDGNSLCLNPVSGGEVLVKYIPCTLFKTLSQIIADSSVSDKNETYENQTANICQRFAEALVLGALYRAALSEEDTSLANSYKAQYEERRGRAMLERYQKGLYPITKIVR